MNRRTQTAQILNGLGALTGEGEIVEPLTTNELELRQTRWIIGGIVTAIAVIVFSIASYNIHYNYAQKQQVIEAIHSGYEQSVLPNGSVGWVKPK